MGGGGRDNHQPVLSNPPTKTLAVTPPSQRKNKAGKRLLSEVGGHGQGVTGGKGQGGRWESPRKEGSLANSCIHRWEEQDVEVGGVGLRGMEFGWWGEWGKWVGRGRRRFPHQARWQKQG